MSQETADDNLIDRRMALAREWDETVAEVQKLEGFEDFLRPPKLQDLLPAAEYGPVVVVNVSQWRCDALILDRDEDREHDGECDPDPAHKHYRVLTVPLEQLSLEETGQRTRFYLETLETVEHAYEALAAAKAGLAESDPPRSAILAERRAVRAVDEAEAAADEMLTALQAWMWEVIAQPVLDELEYGKPPSDDPATWPHVWWCPTGALTVLPLHTAGYHGEPVDGGPARTVLDRVVSSYTPTLRALIDARKPDRRISSDDEPADLDRMLVVSVSEVDGQVPLNTEAESKVLADLFGDSRTELPEGKATRDAVRAALGLHRWVHFSCHGDQDLQDPSSGGLRLYDGMLTIADLTAERFHGDFAGLSACKTAMGGINLLDEAITLAAALHYLGYRHVVATLWSVQNKMASQVFTSLYQRIVIDGRLQPDLAAGALHHAVRDLRRQYPDQPHTWTAFTHTGP